MPQLRQDESMRLVAGMALMAEEMNGSVAPAFGPGLQLAGGHAAVLIRSLAEAAVFLRGYRGRWPATEGLVLRLLVAASTDKERGEAARTFRWWAKLEGLLRKADEGASRGGPA
jgi:hypothetical protein